MSEKAKVKYKTYLGIIELSDDKTMFKAGKVEFPVALSEAQEAQIRKNPDCKVILREGEGKPFIRVCNPTDQVENRAYSYYVKYNDDGEIEKAGLRTFSEPYFESEKAREHVNAQERNELAYMICLHPEQGTFIQIEGSHGVPQRGKLTAEEYMEQVKKAVGHKINVLKDMGVDAKQLTVFYSNVDFMTFNKTFVENNAKQIEERSQKMRENSNGRFGTGYIPFSKSSKGQLFANALPITTSTWVSHNPLMRAGRMASMDDKEAYPLAAMTEALAKDKERFKAAKEIAKQEEEESAFSPSM